MRSTSFLNDKLGSLIQTSHSFQTGRKTLLAKLCIWQETRKNHENHLQNLLTNEKTICDFDNTNAEHVSPILKCMRFLHECLLSFCESVAIGNKKLYRIVFKQVLKKIEGHFRS